MTLKDFAILILVFVFAIAVSIIAVEPIKSNTTQIDSLQVENLLLKNKIELLEYKLKQK